MRRLLLLAVLVALVATAVPAAAHQPAPAAPVQVVAAELREVIAAAPSSAGLPWLAMLATGAAAVAFARRPRHALAVVLLIVTVVLAFETGVHSTHHLGRDSGSCSIASVSGQLSATVGDPDVHATPCDLPSMTVGAPAVPVAVSGTLPPDAGRAPPVPSA
jgi:hypothetical protein